MESRQKSVLNKSLSLALFCLNILFLKGLILFVDDFQTYTPEPDFFPKRETCVSSCLQDFIIAPLASSSSLHYTCFVFSSLISWPSSLLTRLKAPGGSSSLLLCPVSPELSAHWHLDIQSFLSSQLDFCPPSKWLYLRFLLKDAPDPSWKPCAHSLSRVPGCMTSLDPGSLPAVSWVLYTAESAKAYCPRVHLLHPSLGKDLASLCSATASHSRAGIWDFWLNAKGCQWLSLNAFEQLSETALLSRGKAFFVFSEVTRPVSLFLKKQGNLGFGPDETVQPPLRCVYLGEHNIWIGAGVFTEPGFSLTMQENFLVMFLPYKFPLLMEA